MLVLLYLPEELTLVKELECCLEILNAWLLLEIAPVLLSLHACILNMRVDHLLAFIELVFELGLQFHDHTVGESGLELSAFHEWH